MNRLNQQQRELIESNLHDIERRCYHIASRKNWDYDETLRHGYYAACRLAQAWRPDQDLPFYIYLQLLMPRRIIDAHREEEHRVRNSYRFHTAGPIDDWVGEIHAIEYDDYLFIEFTDMVSREFCKRDAEIIARKLLLDEPYDRIAERYDITSARCCQIYKAALPRLREIIAAA